MHRNANAPVNVKNMPKPNPGETNYTNDLIFRIINISICIALRIGRGWQWERDMRNLMKDLDAVPHTVDTPLAVYNSNNNNHLPLLILFTFLEAPFRMPPSPLEYYLINTCVYNNIWKRVSFSYYPKPSLYNANIYSRVWIYMYIKSYIGLQWQSRKPYKYS